MVFHISKETFEVLTILHPSNIVLGLCLFLVCLLSCKSRVQGARGREAEKGQSLYFPIPKRCVYSILFCCYFTPFALLSIFFFHLFSLYPIS